MWDGRCLRAPCCKLQIGAAALLKMVCRSLTSPQRLLREKKIVLELRRADKKIGRRCASSQSSRMSKMSRSFPRRRTERREPEVITWLPTKKGSMMLWSSHCQNSEVGSFWLVR